MGLMKLNADILFEHLNKHFNVEMRGTPGKRLALSRPIFYMDHQTEFAADQLYLASADHLPPYPRIRQGVVLVCIGESLQLSYYYSRCTVLLIQDRCDYFSVYLRIQEIFERFAAWNDKLFELFQRDSDIQKILECSLDIFQRPLIVIDQDFHFLAAAGTSQSELQSRWKDRGENLSQYAIRSFLSKNAPKTNEKKPIFLKLLDTNALCVNLF